MRGLALIALTLAILAGGPPATAAARDGCERGFGACNGASSLLPQAHRGRGWGRGGDDDPRDAFRSGQILPLETILRGVRGRYPGRLLDANLLHGGEPVYVIKILDHGNRVRLLRVDARTGKILSAR